MANVSAPFGFRQFGEREGAAPTAGLERFLGLSSDTNSYFTGDLVAISSQSLVAGFLTNAASQTGSAVPPLGVFLGCEYFSPTVGRVVWSSYFPGNVGSSSPWNAYVCTDPNQLYIAQGTSAAVLGSSCVNFGITYSTSLVGGNGNTLSGISAMTLLSSLVTGLSSNATFRIVDVYANYAPPGVNGTSTGSEGLQIMVVQPNNFVRGARTTATST